ncbi:hypothetical protein AC579_4985 [Pseudocercospora musae]|uniref:Uncharacterized protein n=1 Tax=Pseudocercospora musae TaxID=113226 RepID=A0A139IG63_9PEZI|nr:hypothetical protein AC579_4985 [Pseudocercospora musae]
MTVTMAGDKFSERFEQEALIDVLEERDRMHAWPTGMANADFAAYMHLSTR